MPLAGLTKLEGLYLGGNQITDLTPLMGLQELKGLHLSDNPNLTNAEIEKLQKALPGCDISHNVKK
jgi:internalin A